MLEFLFARADPFRSLTRSFKGQGPSSDNAFLLIAIFLIGLFWAALYFWDKWRKKHVKQAGTPRSLFRSLCDAHKLARSERALLLKATKPLRLGEPAMIFVDPRIVEKFASSPGPEAGPYSALSTKLFGS